MRPFTVNAYVMSTILAKQYACVLNTQCVPKGRLCLGPNQVDLGPNPVVQGHNPVDLGPIPDGQNPGVELFGRILAKNPKLSDLIENRRVFPMI